MIGRGLAGLDPCVHCGFCLQSCPTYLSTGDEADSPRGRIVLIKGLLQGRISPRDERLSFHLDRCLGCRSCESSCPSGVSYGLALEHARTVLAETRTTPLVARTVNAVMADRRLWWPLLTAARMVRPVARRLAGKSKAGIAFGMLWATQPMQREVKGRNSPTPHPASSPPDSPAALFTGCIMDGLFAHVHRATERTLVANGVSITAVVGQGCCGALHAHSGQIETARELARTNVRAFAVHPQVPVVVNSAGCGAIMKEYGEILVGDPMEDAAREFSARVRDVTEVLAGARLRQGAVVRLRVAYDPPCHLLHAQSIADAPMRVLQAVPGLELLAHRDADQCCGSAGSYSLTESVLSRSILDRKIKALTEANPDLVATGNPGCLMQIGAGLQAVGSSISVAHPIELLDLSYRRAGFYDV